MSIEARRGEIWLAALGASRLGELGKTRPVLILTPDWAAPQEPTDRLLVAPLSASRGPSALRVRVPASRTIERDSVVVCDAAGAVAASRLIKRLGMATPDVVAATTRIVVGLVGGPRDLPLG
ncbi:MAG: type II toxin-antitoxin system PemK/MazF family toxin [Bifidobacteriaceae bacterium]|jgi:mRNA-degrading endonuclease toxin of MazEF toxin-antitoxin module|nr:type II toxin-antitoxin system PemK/MazF family toxin [Bifidobacteriaceae bacterium]